MEELHLFLTPNNEHQELFPNVLLTGFQNSKILKDFLVRPKLPKLEESGKFKSCEKHVRSIESISTTTTFTTEA